MTAMYLPFVGSHDVSKGDTQSLHQWHTSVGISVGLSLKFTRTDVDIAEISVQPVVNKASNWKNRNRPELFVLPLIHRYLAQGLVLEGGLGMSAIVFSIC